MVDREVSWLAEKINFELELEKFLSHCPNMTGEDDRRDLCDGNCDVYSYCVSIEPSDEACDKLEAVLELFYNQPSGFIMWTPDKQQYAWGMRMSPRAQDLLKQILKEVLGE